MERCMSAIIALPLVAIGSVLAGTSDARAHGWYSDRRDPVFSGTTCCGNQDCAPLPSHAMHVTPDGLRVVLTLVEAQAINPARSEPFNALIPFDRIQVSEDGRPHICLMTTDRAAYGDKRQGFFCIFLPPNG